MRKPIKKPAHNFIFIRYADHVTEGVYIKFTNNADTVADTLFELCRKVLGAEFGADQENEIKERGLIKAIENLLTVDLKTGFSTFYRINLINGVEVIPYISFSKTETENEQ